MAWLIVVLLAPVLVNVADKGWLVPVWTFPKVMLEGETASCPAVVPIPETGTVTVVVVVGELPPLWCPFP